MQIKFDLVLPCYPGSDKFRGEGAAHGWGLARVKAKLREERVRWIMQGDERRVLK
jgi:hypothetical protein